MSELDNIVLSTGGGALVLAENRELLKSKGYIIYLKSSPEMLCKRTADDKRRPLLQGENRLEQITKILNEREPDYIAMADEIIDSEKSSIKQIIQKILKQIEKDENY